MRKFFSNRIVISVLSFIVGGACIWAYDHRPVERPIAQIKIYDPFDDLRQMEDLEMSGMGGIKEKEDAKFTYYEIETGDQTPKELKVDVQDGQVTISGVIESKNEDGNSQSYYSSSFHRSFPVPTDVEADKFKMEQADKKIILKFPKKNFT